MSGIPIGRPNCAVLMSKPIDRLSLRSSPESHSRTGSLPPAVMKNRTDRMGFWSPGSLMLRLYHKWYSRTRAAVIAAAWMFTHWYGSHNRYESSENRKSIRDELLQKAATIDTNVFAATLDRLQEHENGAHDEEANDIDIAENPSPSIGDAKDGYVINRFLDPKKPLRREERHFAHLLASRLRDQNGYNALKKGASDFCVERMHKTAEFGILSARKTTNCGGPLNDGLWLSKPRSFQHRDPVPQSRVVDATRRSLPHNDSTRLSEYPYPQTCKQICKQLTADREY